MANTKICVDCGEAKPYERGHWHWSARSGAHGPRCKECRRLKYYDTMQEARAAHVQRLKESAETAHRLHKENVALRKKLARLRRMLNGE